MKKNFFYLTLILLVFVTLLVAQQSTTPIEKRWKTVEELAGKQLPESALKEVESILAQARREKNSVEVIKAMVYKMRFTLEKNQDEAPALIHDFETYTEKCVDPAERALLHSMTAELYAQYYRKDAYTINSRTELKGFVPEDMKEWTKNIYFDKINKHLEASMENPSVLQQSDALRFAALLNKGEDSRLLQPTLFDFLGYRKINLLTTLLNNSSEYFADNYATDSTVVAVDTVAVDTVAVDTAVVTVNANYGADNAVKQDSTASLFEIQIRKTLQSLIEFREREDNIPALVYAKLQQLNFNLKHSKSDNPDVQYLNELNELEKAYSGNEAVVEVMALKANYYLVKSRDYRNLDNDQGDVAVESIKAKTTKNQRLAYDICVEGIKRFPHYNRIQLLENTLNIILQKAIRVKCNEIVKPKNNLQLEITSKNIDSLKLSVYRINASAVQYYTFMQNKINNKVEYPDKTFIETQFITIKNDHDFADVETTFNLKTGDYGIYEICLEDKGNKISDEISKSVFTVSDFGFFWRSLDAKTKDVYVTDRQSGLRQPDVNVQLYDSKWNGKGYAIQFVEKNKTDNNGLCQFKSLKNENDNVLFLEKGNDVFFSTSSYSSFFDSNNQEKDITKVNIFTDRSLYRPGQMIYFKGIAYCSNKNKHTVVANKIYEVTFNDANGQKVSSKKLTTNDFGSFSGEFIIPEGGLNGAYTIDGENFSNTIYVEEYKRPTFEVKIEKPTSEVRFGEKAIFKGNVKAFSGYNISNAKVKYRIVRRTHHYCYWFYEPEKEVTNGTVTSKADGSFEVSFIPERTKPANGLHKEQIYTYTILADITDSKGETQQSEQYLSVGDQSLFIIADMPDKIDRKKETNLDIRTETLNEEDVNSKIKYTLYRLAESETYTEKLDNKTSLKEAGIILSGTFDTKDKKLKLNLNKQESGRYKILLNAVDSQGKEVRFEKTFILYDTARKRPPIKSYVWLLTPKTECEIGEKARIIFGTSTKNSTVLYEIMQGNKVLESRWIPFSNEVKNFDVTFKDAYGAGVTAMFTFIRDEQLFTESVQIKHKVVKRQLTPTLSIFRNKIQPGEKAEWTITVPESVKDKRTAELLVGMYDASLDAIRSHSWNFDPTYREEIKEPPVWDSNCFNSNFNSSGLSNQKYKEIKDFQFDQLNWFGLIQNYSKLSGYLRLNKASISSMESDRSAVKSSRSLEFTSVTETNRMMVEPSPAFKSSIKFTAPVIKKDEEVLGDNEFITTDVGKIKKVQLRTNFNETAFFYPQLRTDSAGNVKFTFTAPESLTRWNVKMLAHTQDLYFGQGEAQVVTQKDLMVQMNLPRFVRRSDRLVLSANVINLTDKELTATVEFELIDPATEKQIQLKAAAPKTVVLAAHETKTVEWEITEFSPYELVTCKVVARAGNFSDGEQKYLPVLPDKVLLTESMPLTIRGNQTRTFNFDSFLKNNSKVDTKSLTVEFASNPAWYAVQALPSLAVPEYENAIDYFAAYYVNSLATHIANSTPKIAATFDRWKKAGGSREALLSNLEKNTELKNMLLDETPWVMAAKDETEQKKQITLLFDLNMQKNQAQQYLDKLISLQLPSGGFSWFKGMPESRYVTQDILLNLGRLNSMLGGKALAAYLLPLTAALKYLDLEIAHDFENLKQYNKNYTKEMCIDNMQLFYLHVRSEYPEIPVEAKAVEAVKFYTAQSEKYWTDLTLYGKGMMAVVAHRNGKAKVADEILKSLKENALKTDEFGMYWAKNTAGYFWNEQPIAVQAAIIEAFAEVENTADVEEMKLWLLKQKQTQRWNSPMTSLDAIYALLHNGSNWLENNGDVKIKLGNALLQPENTEAGTGYFKETIPATNVRQEMGKVTVSTRDARTKSGIGWGAMYWQYYQDQDKVSDQSGPLKVTKKLFVEKITAAGKTMIPVEQTELKKGDKVITRLVITTDRNLEFVALKDLRAACFEPVNQLSGCEWKEGVCYYQTTKDASTQFFFSYLPKGTYVFEYELWANSAGDYTSGIASLQCLYAPEFVSHTGGERIKVN